MTHPRLPKFAIYVRCQGTKKDFSD